MSAHNQNQSEQDLYDELDESVSQQGGTEYSGEIRGHYNPDDNVLPNGDLTIIEKRRRILECFSDMMAHSLSDMENYFSELEDFITLSDNDKVHLFHSSMLEILILKCYWTYKNGQFVHPQTQEVMVNKEILLLGTNDVNFVNRFLGLFHEMEQLGFGEKEICLLICISMFDVGRTDITELDDREGIERRQNGYVTQLVQLVKPEHVSDTLMMRTTLKELKTGFAELLGRTESNHTVDMGQKVYEFIERLRNPEKRANSIGGGQNPMHQQ